MLKKSGHPACNTMWPGQGLPPHQVASWSIQPFGHNRHGPKIGALWTQQTWAKNWGLCPPFLMGGGFPSNTMSPYKIPISISSGILIHPAVRPQQTWAENWGLCSLGEGGAGPHLTRCGRGLPARQVSSWSIQPFDHNTPRSETDRIDREERQWSISTGWTVLQMVTQKVWMIFMKFGLIGKLWTTVELIRVWKQFGALTAGLKRGHCARAWGCTGTIVGINLLHLHASTCCWLVTGPLWVPRL